uniref:Coiled-coil domain containing 106 n=1 Tax=Maylandia zebra TaxID=106582 RepID=A0A3P9B874_9CICH
RSGRSSQRGTNRHTEGSSSCAMDGKLTFLKEKLEWQKKRIEELEGERDFLRSQLSSLTSMKLDLFHEHCFYFTVFKLVCWGGSISAGDRKRLNRASENSDSSFASSSVSSVWSSSSSSPKKRKHKYNKKHSRAKKPKKEQKKLRQCVQTPNDIVQRYKSLLKTFPKHGLDRNTVVSTSSDGELAIAVRNVYQELLSNRPSGETVLAFAKRCEAAIQGSDEVKNKIESMKAAGTLLPIRRGKSV